MIELTEAEAKHIDAFISSRGDWNLSIMSKRLIDEDDGSRSHKYGTTHPYITGMLYVMRYFRGKTAKVLDIGSPLQQNVALAMLPGIDLTVMDVRPNADSEELGLKWVNGTATNIPFPDASVDYLTSLWVMGHVGDARYGDAYDSDGDRHMISEVARVLKPGGVAIIGPGLVDAKCGNIFNLHRIYSWEWLREEFARSGFIVADIKNLPVQGDWFLDGITPVKKDGFYGLATLIKR